MTLTPKTTHLEEALAQLAEQFHGKPEPGTVLAPFVGEVQTLETVLTSTIDAVALAYAEGAQLDGIGKIVGEAREGREDEAYRSAIGARILLNNSSGTIEDLIGLTRALLGDVAVQVVEVQPAHFELIIAGSVPASPPEWAPLTPYAVGDKVSNFGNAYEATLAGTSGSGSGPSGFGASILDGGVIWAYTGPGVGLRVAALVLSGKPGGVRGVFVWSESADAFAFDGGSDGLGFDQGKFAQAIEA